MLLRKQQNQLAEDNDNDLIIKHIDSHVLPIEKDLTLRVTPIVCISVLGARPPLGKWTCAAEGFIWILSSLSS